MKKATAISGVLAGLIIIGGVIGINRFRAVETAQREFEEASMIIQPKHVHTKTLQMENYSEDISYSGCVVARDTKKYAFEIAGTIEEVCVEKGQYIKPGQVLAKLNTSTTQLGLDNSMQSVHLASNKMMQAQTGIEAEKLAIEKIKSTYDSNIEQLQIQYDLQKEICEGNQAVYDSGALSKIELDNANASLDILEEKIENLKTEKEQNIRIEETKLQQLTEQMEAAIITLNQAQVGVSQNQEVINKSVLTSTMEGYVLDVMVKAGEVAGAGTPIVVVKTKDQIIRMGVSAEAYHTLSEGMEVQIEKDEEIFKGKVTKVALYPDETTRNYDVEITPEKQDLVLGSLVSVNLNGTKQEGCFIPLSAVVNIDGVNYVYQASKKESGETYIIERVEVILGKVQDESVLAMNLSEGTIIVDEGIRDIKEKDEVII